MTIHWSLFVPGVLVLLYPADRLLSSLVELRSFDCFQNLENSPRYRPWWWVPALWVDPLRGFLGTFLLQRAVEIPAVTWALIPKAEYALLVGVVALGVLSQTLLDLVTRESCWHRWDLPPESSRRSRRGRSL
jgi:hypothetical protein